MGKGKEDGAERIVRSSFVAECFPSCALATCMYIRVASAKRFDGYLQDVMREYGRHKQRMCTNVRENEKEGETRLREKMRANVPRRLG